jgi:hypothetical protein
MLLPPLKKTGFIPITLTALQQAQAWAMTQYGG